MPASEISFALRLRWQEYKKRGIGLKTGSGLAYYEFGGPSIEKESETEMQAKTTSENYECRDMGCPMTTFS